MMSADTNHYAEAKPTRKPIPPHWALESFPGPQPVSSLLRHAFKLLCIISFGDSDLNRAWEIAANEDQSTWMDNRDRTSNRISNTTVVDGLLLGSLAAFVTTPPPVPHLLDYNQRGPYVCLYLAFGITLGGLIVGSAVVFIMAKTTPVWFRETLMASRSSVCCTLILMGYPFVCTGVATLVLAFGLLIAGWTSHDLLLQISSVLLLIVPASMGLVYGWIHAGVLWQTLVGKAERGSNLQAAEGLLNAESCTSSHQHPAV